MFTVWSMWQGESQLRLLGGNIHYEPGTHLWRCFSHCQDLQVSEQSRAETKVVSLINTLDPSATVVVCVPASLISAGLEVLVP